MARYFFAVALTFIAASPAYAASLAPTHALRYGDTSADVLLLQQVLNASPDTGVALTGPGSPGFETAYFGAKTLDAVKRFQAKNGIETTGFVGPITLSALKNLTQVAASAPNSGSSAPQGSQDSSKSTLDQYVTSVRTLGTAQGASNDSLNQIESAIRSQAATSTDYLKEFYEKQQSLYKQTHSVSAVLKNAIFGLFAPKVALALTGLPFGGIISYVSPICTCNPIVQQIFVALPQPTPTSNFVLDYVDGTEAFEWYNLPLPGLATLGEYTPGSQTCYFFTGHVCIPVPAVGTIQPIVGSSLTPTI